jgi:hypothetical protein
MLGPNIIVRTLSSRRSEPDAWGNCWQYHSRSDHHSKVACWALLFDMLRVCPTLAEHIRRGRIGYGINHEMHDFAQNRKKNLDLVICSPGTNGRKMRGPSFKSLVSRYDIELSQAERDALGLVPDIPMVSVGSVYIAVEAKACMTEHLKALPRLYDELNSSQLTIHGAADQAVAVGFVLVNSSGTFLSPGRNQEDLSRTTPVENIHNQPHCTRRVVEKVGELPRRKHTGEDGFDALGLMVVSLRNDGGRVALVTEPPAPQPGDILHYSKMVDRVKQLYSSRFPQL